MGGAREFCTYSFFVPSFWLWTGELFSTWRQCTRSGVPPRSPSGAVLRRGTDSLKCAVAPWSPLLGTGRQADYALEKPPKWEPSFQ